MALPVLRWASLVLAAAGVAVLLILAGSSRVPTMRIGDLTPTMNWAYLRVEGIVSRQPAVDPESGALKLWVRDETGEILAMAYRAEAEALQAAGRVPVMGDGLALEGTLRVREEFCTLVINLPETVEVRPAEPATMAIEQVQAALAGQKVRLRGAVRGLRIPYEGLQILSLRDETAAIDVVLPPAAEDAGALLPQLVPGQALEVVGAVDLYDATPQVSVGRWSDLALLEGEVTVAPARRAGELAASDVGHWARLQGSVAKSLPLATGAGLKLTLDDGTGRVTILLWDDLLRSLPVEDLAEGATLEVQGQVAEYRGDLEIVPELASDLLLLVPPTPREVPARAVAELSTGDLGQVVRVEGVLLSLRAFSAGRKGILDDGTGTVTLLLWQDVYDALPNVELVQPGARLRVEGEVAEYGGALEVVPLAPAGVAVTGRVTLEVPKVALDEVPAPTPSATPASTPATPTATASETSKPATPTPAAAQATPPPTRTIGSLGSADLGSEVTLARAGVAEVIYFSKGVQYRLTDATGSIILLLWQNVLEEIPIRLDLYPGSQVWVSGQIQEYQGNLEIVPRDADGVSVVARGDRLPVEERSLGSITPSDEGRVFAVAGRVTRTESRGWLRLWIDDGTGTMLIYLPERLIPYLPQGLDPGAWLAITGEVDVYQGMLEIIPLAGCDVVRR